MGEKVYAIADIFWPLMEQQDTWQSTAIKAIIHLTKFFHSVPQKDSFSLKKESTQSFSY
jgi:hypothetical protein